MVCLLQKSLYESMQSPRQWYKRFDQFMKAINFKKSNYDNCVYHNGITGRDQILLLLYADDMLIVAKDLQQIKDIKIKQRGEF